MQILHLSLQKPVLLLKQGNLLLKLVLVLQILILESLDRVCNPLLRDAGLLLDFFPLPLKRLKLPLKALALSLKVGFISLVKVDYFLQLCPLGLAGLNLTLRILFNLLNLQLQLLIFLCANRVEFPRELLSRRLIHGDA